MDEGKPTNPVPNCMLIHFPDHYIFIEVEADCVCQRIFP